MTKNLEDHFNILQKEIDDIRKNIHKVRKKNHKTMSHIVQKIKYISKDIRPIEDSVESSDNLLNNNINVENTLNKEKNNKNINYNNYLRTYDNNKAHIKTNYKKYQPIIYLYKNYKNDAKNIINFNSPPNSNKHYNNTIDNCITLDKDKFFFGRAKTNTNDNNNNRYFFKDSFDILKKHDKKESSYNKKESKTIDIKPNFNKMIQTEANSKYKKNNINMREIINFNNNKKNNIKTHLKNKIRECYFKHECEKLDESINNKDKIKHNIFFGNIHNKSMNHLYKKKINSFKEKSEPYFKKIPLKDEEILDIKKMNINNKTISKTNDIEGNLQNAKNININKNHKKYNSIDIHNIKNGNNYIINKDKNKDKIKDADIQHIEKIKEIIKKYSRQKSFIHKILKIYNKYNNENISSNNYENLILWINNLLHTKQNNSNDKYKKFCKDLMKENNITDFSFFQKFARSIINEKKNANNFLEDIKKILSVDELQEKQKKI